MNPLASIKYLCRIMLVVQKIERGQKKKKNKQTKASSLRVKTKRKRNVRGNSFNTKAALD